VVAIPVHVSFHGEVPNFAIPALAPIVIPGLHQLWQRHAGFGVRNWCKPGTKARMTCGLAHLRRDDRWILRTPI